MFCYHGYWELDVSIGYEVHDMKFKNFSERLSELVHKKHIHIQYVSGPADDDNKEIHAPVPDQPEANTAAARKAWDKHNEDAVEEPEKWKKLKQGDMELIVGDGKRKEALDRGTGNNVVDLEEVRESQTTADEVGKSDAPEVVANESDENTGIRRSSRTRKEPERYLWNLEGAEVLVVADSDDAPANYKSAISDLESAKWLEAMNAEMQSMRENQVWNLVELPPESRAIGSKWLFKRKPDMHGKDTDFFLLCSDAQQGLGNPNRKVLATIDNEVAYITVCLLLDFLALKPCHVIWSRAASDLIFGYFWFPAVG
ncbi:hypothetical protein QVD17_36952 [Tagetes erecta]|uniref:Reverse transcriptase Ty1/copia-type domain-containing protein n=1 Tax=Tagetes erecta TaxID=13708 RepID=A0AAD8NCB6_TARER|nr:hypothetical protein QVD17_36952 [Tagetes erecta]